MAGQTRNPRIAFVPSDAINELLKQFSATTGRTKASLVAELMDDLAPIIQMQVEAVRKIVARPEAVRQHITEMAMEAKAMIDQQVLNLPKPKRQRKRKGATSGPP
jgi:predicted DNA-binding protein